MAGRAGRHDHPTRVDAGVRAADRILQTQKAQTLWKNVNQRAQYLKGSLFWVALGGTIALSIMAYIAQKKLWRTDMKAKAETETNYGQ